MKNPKHNPGQADSFCDFTDELEHFSTLNIEVAIWWKNSSQGELHSRGYILDIVSEKIDEFLVLSDGTKILLNQIIEVTAAGSNSEA